MKMDDKNWQVSYKDVAIKQLEHWGWDVEYYRVYGIPWYLKLYLYPIIWCIRKEVEGVIKRIIKGNENGECL